MTLISFENRSEQLGRFPEVVRNHSENARKWLGNHREILGIVRKSFGTTRRTLGNGSQVLGNGSHAFGNGSEIIGKYSKNICNCLEIIRDHSGPLGERSKMPRKWLENHRETLVIVRKSFGTTRKCQMREFPSILYLACLHWVYSSLQADNVLQNTHALFAIPFLLS